MKNKNYFLSITLIAIVLSAASCKKSDDSNPGNLNTSQLTAGEWKVNSFHDDSNDRTAEFSEYTFTFGSDGSFNANNSGTITSGSWDFDDSGNEFHLNIGSGSPLSDISKGWIILESTSATLKLGDDSGNDEELDFVKL